MCLGAGQEPLWREHRGGGVCGRQPRGTQRPDAVEPCRPRCVELEFTLNGMRHLETRCLWRVWSKGMASLTCVFKNLLLTAVWKMDCRGQREKSRDRGLRKLVRGGGPDWGGGRGDGDDTFRIYFTGRVRRIC